MNWRDPVWPARDVDSDLEQHRVIRVCAVVKPRNHPDFAKEVQGAIEALINRADDEQIVWTEEGPYENG